MRSLARCYSEHAIKVSDSYCSGPSNRAYLSPNMTFPTPNTIICIYRAKLFTGKNIIITITWCNKTTGNGLTIKFGENLSTSDSHRLKKSKGFETFQSCNSKIEVFWDLSDARYINGPEPDNRFYIMVVVDSEICLLLGDMDEEAKRMKTDFQDKIAGFSLVSRSENFSGCSVYSTKARFCDAGLAHEILIKCGEEGEGPKNRELSVSIDKKMIFQVKRLAWNFRGNQTIYLDNGLLVDMMWDLHDWLFNQEAAAAGRAVFMFRRRSGLDSRLWLEEKSSEQKDNDRGEFSLLICGCKNPD
ncbi:hypothetical protein SLE2022_123810 [Rubroshorea leprosula]